MAASPVSHLFFLLSTHGGPEAVCACLRDASIRFFQDRTRPEPESFGKKNLQSLAADACLGALCGTLSQHFGFMGSLEDCRFWAEKSIWAFGGRENRETRDNWIRAFHYRVYAACDGGEFEAAKRIFSLCLGVRILKLLRSQKKGCPGCWPSWPVTGRMRAALP